MATNASGSMDPDKIPGTSFATSFRGFDADEVRSYLHRVAGEVRALQHRNEELKAQLAEILESSPEPAAEPVELDEAEVTRLLGAETARVLATARESAAQIEASAREDAERVEAEAGVRAGEIEASAETVLADRTAEAEAAVEELIDEGRRERDELIASGEAERDRLIGEGDDSLEAAKEDGRQMVAEAKALRHKILTDMARRRNVGRRQLEQLRASRERLLEGYSSLRRSLEESVTEIQQSAEDAKVAGDRAGRRVNIDEIESIEELEAEVDLAKSTGLLTIDTPTADDAVDDGAVDDDAVDGEVVDDEIVDGDADHEAGRLIEADTDADIGEAVVDDVDAVDLNEESVADADVQVADESDDVYADQPPLGSVARPHGSSHVTVLGPIDSETGEVITESERAERTVDAGSDDAGPVDEAQDEAELDADPVFADDGTQTLEESAEGDDRDGEAAEADDDASLEPAAALSDDVADDQVAEGIEDDADPGDGDEDWEGVRILGPTDSDDDAADDADDELIIDLRDDAGTDADVDPSADDADDSADAQPSADNADEAPAAGGDDEGSSPIVVQRRQQAPAAAATAAASDSSSVDALFAQLRAGANAEPDAPVNEPFATVGPTVDDAADAETADADTADADAVAEQAESDVEGVELADQVSGPADRALLSRRDAMVDGVIRDLGRRLKRALSDDQNDLLERIRAKNGTFTNDDLPSADEQLAAFGLSCRNELRTAAAVGATFVGGVDVEGFDPETVDLSDVEDEIAGAIAMPLRDRFEEAIAETGGDPDQLAERLRASYREVRSQRINPLADHFALVAFARGGQQVAAPKARFRWVSDNCGPDCLDNALEGELAAGTAFPTGHTHPPSHLGCRCLLALAD